MDITAKLKQIFFALLFLPTIALAQTTAGTEIANIQSWLNHEGQKYYKAGTGDQWVRNSSPNGDRYVKVETNIDYKASNGRNYPVVIEKTAQIDGTKIGKAMVKLAKVATPLSLGFAVFDVVCELSDICKAQDSDTWQYTTQGVQATDAEATGWCQIDRTQTLQQCLPAQRNCGYETLGGVSNNKCTNFALHPSDSRILTFTIYNSLGQFIGTSTLTRDNPFQSTTGVQRAPTEEDWANAENSLNDPRFDEPLLVNGQPVPLANLPILGNTPPITLSDSETINRDSQGNITGTTRTTTTLTLTDTATETRPGSVTGTETTTKTDYDTQGQPIGTQTSTSNPPPPEKPAEPPTISFDDVQDSEIEEEEIDFDLDEGESWGEGFCPPDETISYGYGTLTFDYQPACDFAANVRPVLLLIASITAMFIVSGIRVE